jgi:hypothetical protein
MFFGLQSRSRKAIFLWPRAPDSRTFSRTERRLLLSLLERLPDATEDMLRWKGRWVRLGVKLHPGEFQKRYPKTAAAFRVLREDLPFSTFNSSVEKALADKNIVAAASKLSSRPGDFARRLDHLLRTTATHRTRSQSDSRR